MATWDHWMPDLMIHEPTAPDPLIRQLLCRSAREFFRRTKAWTEWLDPLTSLAGAGLEYAIAAPVGAKVLSIDRATVGAQPLAVLPKEQAPTDWASNPSGFGRVLITDTVSAWLMGEFAAGEIVQIHANLLPELSAAGIPDSLADAYLEAIAAGAKALLFVMPAYFKPDLATHAKAEFETAIGLHAALAYRSHTTQTPRATPKWC